MYRLQPEETFALKPLKPLLTLHEDARPSCATQDISTWPLEQGSAAFFL